jgi:DNA sulfur modification protein DndB
MGHDMDRESLEKQIELATAFWNEVARHIPDWGLAKERKVSPAELRRDYIHAHSLALAALARAGRDLLAQHPRDWKQKLNKLDSLD